MEIAKKVKAIYKNNILYTWSVSESNAKTFLNLGFVIRELSEVELLRELQAITRINQQKEIDDLEFDSSESIE